MLTTWWSCPTALPICNMLYMPLGLVGDPFFGSGLTTLLSFFYRTFVQQHVLGPVPVLAADYGLSGAGWEPAVGGCLQPACVSQELVQSGWVTSSTELCGCSKLEQRSREGSLRSNGEDATPTVHPSGLSSAAHGDRCAAARACARSRTLRRAGQSNARLRIGSGLRLALARLSCGL